MRDAVFKRKTMARRRNMLAALALGALVASCVNRVYLDSWQPLRHADQQGLPRLVTEAIALRSADLEPLRAAGAELIGHHEARTGWARRAGSTGGTHIIPVNDGVASGAGCATFGETPVCSFAAPGRPYRRVAVFRVPPERWHLLPFHLVPPRSVMRDGVRASAWRDDCRVHNTHGTTSCSRSVRLVTP